MLYDKTISSSTFGQKPFWPIYIGQLTFSHLVEKPLFILNVFDQSVIQTSVFWANNVETG
jgi:hypothetical protein